MVYKSFRVFVVLRLLMLAGASWFFIFCITKTNWQVTTILSGATVLFLIVELIRYVDKVNRDLARFLMAIKYRDFSQTFASDGKGKSFNELRDSFNIIIKEFQKISTEMETNHHYLQTVVEHVPVGLITMDEKGELALMNEAAKNLFDLMHAKNIVALDKKNPGIAAKIQAMQSGEKQLIKINIRNESMQVAAHVIEFKTQEKKYKLISFKNIKSELDEKEIESWQKLIRVLTHEIMNSVTPISSLTGSTIKMLENEEGTQRESLDSEEIQDIYSGLKTIEKRSKGLLNFVDLYRNLTKIPQPNIKSINLNELFSNIEKLFQTEFINKKILFSTSASNLNLMADVELIEQVLINLILNAIDALENITEPQMSLVAQQNTSNKIVMHLTDNGSGISEEVSENIFIPFFTTKPKGSGIGLSLSRQIMRLHNGSIAVKSAEGKGTTIILTF